MLPPPLLVNVRTVAEEDVQEYFTGYGSARAKTDVLLAAEVHGLVVEVAEGLNDGVHVEAGQLLVRIDDRQYFQQLARAEAAVADLDAQIDQLDVERTNIARLAAIAEQEVEVNRSELARVASLYEEEQAAKKEFDFARLALQQSRRQLLGYQNQIDLIAPRHAMLEALQAARTADAELGKLDVERCRITAPFSGQVESVSVDVGDHLMVGAEVLRLIATRLIEVPIELPASVHPRLEIGANCRLEADSMPGTRWNGKVARIAPSTDTKSRTFAAYVEVDNDKQQTALVPGYFVTARVEGPMLRQVMAIPRGAIVGNEVYVVNNHVVHARTIDVDKYVGERAVVRGDLAPGDPLALTNLDALHDGMTVRIGTGVDWQDAAASPTRAEDSPGGGTVTGGGGR